MGLLGKPFDSQETTEKPAEHPPLTQWGTFGRGEPVYSIDESRGTQRLIVDSNGNICIR